MSVIERSRQPLEKARDLMGWDQLIPIMQGAQVICQCWPSQILHYNIRVTVDGIEIKNLHDIRMAQSGDYFCLPLKPFQQRRLFLDMAVQQFDGNRPFEIE